MTTRSRRSSKVANGIVGRVRAQHCPAESIVDGVNFTDQLWEIAVLGVVVLLLGVTAGARQHRAARTWARPRALTCFPGWTG